MVREYSQTVLYLYVCVILILLQLGAFAWADDGVQFDVPTMRSAAVLDDLDDDQMIIEVSLPVSLYASDSSKFELDESQFDIFWNRNACQVVDYSPSTTLESDIVGTVKVEKRSDRGGSVGLNLSTGYYEMLDGSGQAQVSSKQGETRQFEEKPEHDLMITAGQIRRGTGVSFRFRPTRTSTLEGHRDLVLAFQVPGTWRGGILTVQCRARGVRRILGISDQTRFGSAFVVPIYLAGDSEARQFAMEFAQREQQLRSAWEHYSEPPAKAGLARQFRSWMTTAPESSLPSGWVHRLIQSGTDEWLDEYQARLPDPVVVTAVRFVQARRELVQIGR